MHLEFVCLRIILPSRVLHDLFRLLKEYDGYQGSRTTEHIKNKTPRKTIIPQGSFVFCVVRRSIIWRMLNNFGNFSYNFIKQFVYLLKILRKVYKGCAKVERISCRLWKV